MNKREGINMKTRILTIITLTAFSVVYSAETNNPPAGTGQASIATNQPVKLKGFMRQTRILPESDEVTIAKVKVIAERMQLIRKPTPGERGPQTIEEASEYLTKNVSMTQAPGACLEHGGVFYFSGGRSTKTETNFVSGFAIKRVNGAIFAWDENDNKEKP
jgi:hypothetical protein